MRDRSRRPRSHHTFEGWQWRRIGHAGTERWCSVSQLPRSFRIDGLRGSIPRNPGGVRFGSAELYDVIDLCFSPEATHHSHTIVDCLAVGQSIAQGTDERVILFVKLLEGENLTEELEKKVRHEIRTRRTARHVPAKVGELNLACRPLTAFRCGGPGTLWRHVC